MIGRAETAHASIRLTSNKLRVSILPETALAKSDPADIPVEEQSRFGRKFAQRMKKRPQSRTDSITSDHAQQVKLLAGGNPQIAKADGDVPVQQYIAAMPGWKSDLGGRLDRLISNAAPDVRKAVRWNSPFYGLADKGWFASFHVFTGYVKLTFFDGDSLRPMPPGAGKDKNARWIDIYESAPLDEARITEWVRQAANLPGWEP